MEVPFADGGVVYEEIGEVEARGNGDVTFFHVPDEEVVREHAAVVGVERSAVGYKGRSKGTVSYKTAFLLPDVRRAFVPTFFFTRERVYELSRGVNFLLRLRRLSLQLVLCLLLDREFFLQLRQVLLYTFEVLLGLLEFLLRDRKPALLYSEENLLRFYDFTLLMVLVDGQRPTEDTRSRDGGLFRRILVEPFRLSDVGV